MSTINRTTTQARDALAIAGIQKHLQNVTSMPLAGSSYTPADLVKLIQSRVDSAREASAAKSQWHAKILADRALTAHLTPVLTALRQYVINVYGATSPVLGDFGFSSSKRATRTPEQKAASAAKAKATRAARHTQGKKQKKAVKGDVTAVIVTPVIAPQKVPQSAATPAIPTTPLQAPATPPSASPQAAGASAGH